jgi:hypothetical protein
MARIMTLQELMAELDLSAEQVNELIRQPTLPGHSVQPHKGTKTAIRCVRATTRPPIIRPRSRPRLTLLVNSWRPISEVMDVHFA